MSDHILQVHYILHPYFFSVVLYAWPQSSQILFVELFVFVLVFSEDSSVGISSTYILFASA